MTAYPLRCHKCDDADYPDFGALITHLRAEHDDLFDITDEDYDTPLDAISQLHGADVLGDARLFSADAEIERLKCCGNCEHHEYWGDGEDCKAVNGAVLVAGFDPCHFDPSRWMGRKS